MDALDKINKSLYGERNTEAMQKAGFQAASTIIEEYLASGEIYGGETPTKLAKEMRVEKLRNIIRETLEKDLEAHTKKLKFDPKGNKISPGDKNCQKQSKKKRCLFF